MLDTGPLFIAGLLAAAIAAAPPVTQPPSAKDDLNWRIFENLYPPRALAAKEEGAVGFIVTLDNKGDVTGCRVTHSSGHPLLDEETCKVITMNAVFKPDASLGPSQTKRHEGMIAWKLPQWATAIEPPKPVAASAAPEQIICKKNLRMGTLSSFERKCMTPTEWAKQSDAMKQTYEEMQGRKGSSGTICIGGMGTEGPGGAPNC